MTRLSAEARWLIATLLLSLAAGLAVALLARDRARTALLDEVRADAQLRGSLINSEIARFRLLPLALGDDRDVVAAFVGRAGAAEALNRKLEMLARATGAAVIYVVAPGGRAIAASNWRTRSSFVGNDYRFRRYVRDARRSGAAAQFALGTVSGRAGLYLSRRSTGGGVIVVKLEFDALEHAWASAGGETLVHDARGVVVVSSRPEWRFAAMHPLSVAQADRVRSDMSLAPGTLRPIPTPGATLSASIRTAQPGWVLVLRRASGPLDLRATFAGVGAAVAVVLLASLLWVRRQRARHARRRTAELEEAVAARTAELTREIEERAASEARAADLREGLRQANRLATLGQVTASVAHETAQPVAAIRTYAQTSAVLLDRGDGAAVRDNLAAITRLSDRIGTVTQELRGFARRRAGPLRAVPLAEVVEGAALILREQLRGVTLDCATIDPALRVMGGRVRLEQVLVNLLQNAVEAVRDWPVPRISLSLITGDAQVVMLIEDNGPGIAPEIAPRLFTPFVTSRSDGLGLGLVIAHDIMLELGGTLRHVDTPAGARFEIVMVRA